MSDTKEAKRPKVTRFFLQSAVYFGGAVKTGMKAGDMSSVIERTPGGLLVRYVDNDGKGGKAKWETFVPDSNIASFDLEAAP